jgi:hypothetical protein
MRGRKLVGSRRKVMSGLQRLFMPERSDFGVCAVALTDGWPLRSTRVAMLYRE